MLNNQCFISFHLSVYLLLITFFFSRAHNVYVEDIMVREVVSVWRGCNYKDLRNILKLKKRLQFFPLVESLGIFIIITIKVFLIFYKSL